MPKINGLNYNHSQMISYINEINRYYPNKINKRIIKDNDQKIASHLENMEKKSIANKLKSYQISELRSILNNYSLDYQKITPKNTLKYQEQIKKMNKTEIMDQISEAEIFLQIRQCYRYYQKMPISKLHEVACQFNLCDTKHKNLSKSKLIHLIVQRHMEAHKIVNYMA